MVSKLLAGSVYLITSFSGQGLLNKGLDAQGNIIFSQERPLPSPLKTKTNLKIAFLGDTGCRLKGTEIQNCADPAAWPLARITQSIHNETPDFVVHVGDYHYRESCKVPAKCAPFADTLGYTWNAWKADWFEPAQALGETPMIYVRGNHEKCSRAWEHWQKYLSHQGPGSLCREQDATQFIELPGLLIVNGDLSGLSDSSSTPNSPQNEALRSYLKNLKLEIQARQRTKREVWVLFHQPAYGVVPYKKESAPDQIEWAGGTPRLSAALRDTGFDEVVDLYISGHIHNAQVSQGDHPLQIVAGESGTKLDSIGDYAKAPIQTKDGSSVFIPTASNGHFGYMVLEFSPDLKQKTLVFKDSLGKPESRCILEDRKATCENLENL